MNLKETCTSFSLLVLALTTGCSSSTNSGLVPTTPTLGAALQAQADVLRSSVEGATRRYRLQPQSSPAATPQDSTETVTHSDVNTKGLIVMVDRSYTDTTAKPLIADTLKPFSAAQQSSFLGANCTTRLEIYPSSKSGNLHTASGLTFTVHPTQSISKFNFDYFEGPGAPATNKKLMKVTLTRGAKKTEYLLSLAGYRSADVADGFTFQASGTDTVKSDRITAILAELDKGADHIDIAITNGKERATVLQVRFAIKPQ